MPEPRHSHKLLDRRRHVLGCILATLGVFSSRSQASELPNSSVSKPRTWPVELEAGKFKIHCNFHLASADSLIKELLRTSESVTKLLHLPQPKTETHVVLFESSQEYGKYMRNYFPQLPQRRALYIQDRGPGMLFTYVHEELAEDLRHEVTHAILNDQLGKGNRQLPLWVDEGVAEYFEAPQDLRFLNPKRTLETRSLLANSNQIRAIEVLETYQDVSEFGDLEYRDSWLWIHFLIHRNQETRGLFIDWLSSHRKAKNHLPLGKSVRLQVPAVEDELRDHLVELTTRVGK